ncbi:MAG: GMC family oxidoreductase [Pseudomonadota bacterium]
MATSAADLPPLSSPLSALKPHYDVIIVGSGYGGAVSAARLAARGLRVAVLERGREVRTGEFATRFPDMRRELRIRGEKLSTGAADGIYDVRLGRDMHVLVGNGLGGGSLVNAGVTLRPDARVFDDEIWPGQIRQDPTLDEGYRRAAAMLRPARDPEAQTHAKFQALARASKGVGQPPIAPTVAVSFEETVNPAGITQPACTRCGDCCGGCNVGAKNTVALTYLPMAVSAGAECFTGLTVQRVAKGDAASNRRWRIYIEPTSGPRHCDAQLPASLTATHVILAAGSLGSTEILLRSREAGLAVSDQLGHRFSANGDIIAFGYGAERAVNGIGVGHPIKDGLGPVGASVSGQIEIDDPNCLENELRIQEGALPSAMAPILPVMFMPNGRLLGAFQALVNGVYKGPLKGLQTFFAVSHDTASGVLELENGALRIRWPNAVDEPVYKRLDDHLRAITAELGADYIKNPLSGTVMGQQPATAHPLGGNPMGADRTTGVVNHRGEVFDDGGPSSVAVHDGLRVIDGSIIPRSLGVNPLYTITALSERAMMHWDE